MRVIRLVDVVPSDHSNETNDAAEPSVAVNPNNSDELVVTAFTPPDAGNSDGPVFFSSDGGETWSVRFDLAGGETHDQSPMFAGSSDELYMGTLRGNNGDLNVLRSNDPTVGPFPLIERRDFVDQPWVEATTVVGGPDHGKDRIYVGYNDTNHGADSATIDVCLDAAAGSSPSFTQVRLDPRSPSPNDSYEIRPAAHADGTVYVAYKSRHSFDATGVVIDVVVARDDNWGSNSFNDLKDPGDHKAGRLVATNVPIADNATTILGGIRLDNDLNLAVDPTNSDVVYVVWCDNSGPSYTLRVRRSLNRGVDWSDDLLTADNASLACLAISARGIVGLLYQQLVSGRMEAHFRTASDGTTWSDVILARTDTSPGFTGDYARLVASGIDFYGVFPAMNSPDPANFFPNGGGSFHFQRNTSGAQLLGSDGTTVIASSVDPFFFKVIERDCGVVTDRSTFSKDEVDALLHLGSPGVIQAAFYAVVDGFRAVDLGITATTFAGAPDVAPAISFSPGLTGLHAQASSCAAAFDQANLTVQQRFTWTFDVRFTSSADFTQEIRPVDLTATITGAGITVTGQAELVLTTQPNPYEVDGSVGWLSTDLRVFKLRQGHALPSTPDVPLSTAGPNDFILRLLDKYNDPSLPRAPGHPFDNDLSTDEQASQLTIAPFEGFPPEIVHNFAIARVRYRALATSAPNVRVFFRLFQVATTSVEFDPTTSYRTGGQGSVKIPVLGVLNGETVTIPCFASARIDTATQSMNEQTDFPNLGPLGHPIPPDGSGAELQVYFGCWLDINQTTPVVPINPSPIDGPFTGPLLSVREAIVRSPHECLVAEINLDPPEPQVAPGQAPSTSDKLAQRNLSIIGVSSPHLVPQPFDLKPTVSVAGDAPPDELMLDWQGLPPGSLASIYFPQLDADEILRLAGRQYGRHALRRADPHTIECPAQGIGFVPIPSGLAGKPTGLLTVELPPTVREGQAYKVVARQITNAFGQAPPPVIEIQIEAAAAAESDDAIVWRRVVGSFQISIPVAAKGALLEPEERLLSILRWIAEAIPSGNRWHPVFVRYLGQIAQRVDDLGGDPDKIKPSPTGLGEKGGREWARLGCASALVLAGVALGVALSRHLRGSHRRHRGHHRRHHHH